MQDNSPRITEQFFDGKTVVVFGLGTNGGGKGTVDFLLGTGVGRIIVTDQKSAAELQERGVSFGTDERLVWHLGGHDFVDFETADVVIQNPGIRSDNPYLVHARERGAMVLMDSAIFFALCKVPIIGVTGSKGKTTTASALAHILETAGREVVRVGVSQTGVLSELRHVTDESVVVFELSSWRLAGLREVSMSPHIAIITNLYPDHLNYYSDMESYAEDKAEIFLWQQENGIVILPEDSPWTEWFGSQAPGRVLSFGQKSGDAWQDEAILWMRDGEVEIPLVEKADCHVVGEHNFANLLAAALAAFEAGVMPADIGKGLETFTGVAHRLELVREKNGVRYINDTAATIPDAVEASVRAIGENIILLAGGSDKGLPLEPLIALFRTSQVKWVLLFAGTATEKIVAALDALDFHRYQVVTSMEEAVVEAAKRAKSGDTVLLSPGAASFGMFQNEFDRGEQFTRVAQKL